MELQYTVSQHTQRLYEIVEKLLQAELKQVQWNDHCGTGYLIQSEVPEHWVVEFAMNKQVLKHAGLNPTAIASDLVKLFEASYVVALSNWHDNVVFIRFRLK